MDDSMQAVCTSQRRYRRRRCLQCELITRPYAADVDQNAARLSLMASSCALQLGTNQLMNNPPR